MSENILSVFMIVTCLAIILQAGILAALYFTVRKTSVKVEALAERALPVLDSARTVLEDSAPKLKEITSNLVSATGTLKGQVNRMDATVNDLLDRTRLQVIRVDELVSRTIDRVEETTELVQHTVVSPVKQISGIIQGLTAGVGAFLMRRRSQQGDELVVEDEELFI
ncbi:MAG TPA: hypothetical protein VM056_00290 [Terriglobales bacterium]|nr:hypothetical protein [Terriglobales bacterium]